MNKKHFHKLNFILSLCICLFPLAVFLCGLCLKFAALYGDTVVNLESVDIWTFLNEYLQYFHSSFEQSYLLSGLVGNLYNWLVNVSENIFGFTYDGVYFILLDYLIYLITFEFLSLFLNIILFIPRIVSHWFLKGVE